MCYQQKQQRLPEPEPCYYTTSAPLRERKTQQQALGNTRRVRWRLPLSESAYSSIPRTNCFAHQVLDVRYAPNLRLYSRQNIFNHPTESLHWSASFSATSCHLLSVSSQHDRKYKLHLDVLWPSKHHLLYIYIYIRSHWLSACLPTAPCPKPLGR